MNPVFVTWRWQQKNPSQLRRVFTADHANNLAAVIASKYPAPHRFVTVTDDPTGHTCETIPLWNDFANVSNPRGKQFPSCFRRLKLFSRDALQILGIEQGTPLISLDLDLLPVADIRPTIDRAIASGESFWGWTQGGSKRKRVYNGSIWLHRAGTMPEVWDDFDPKMSPLKAHNAGFLGSDQGWMGYKIGVDRPSWDMAEGEIVSYNYGRRAGPVIRETGLRPQNRIIVFHGKYKQWDESEQKLHPWIKTHWCGGQK